MPYKPRRKVEFWEVPKNCKTGNIEILVAKIPYKTLQKALFSEQGNYLEHETPVTGTMDP